MPHIERIVPKTTRMVAITKALPDDVFSRSTLEECIGDTIIGGRGIKSPQSVREYVGALQDAGLIELMRQGRYRVTAAATTPGQIVVDVESKLRIPLVLDLIRRALDGTEGVTVEEVKQ